jgi:hypothetical protein
MSLGDHLWVQRIGYRHHGVDLGQGWVVHYAGSLTRPGAITITSAAVFADGSSVNTVHYETRLPIEETVHRAKSRVGENNYRFIDSNCEHFATWCATGLHNSEQVRTVVGTLNLGLGDFLDRLESVRRQKGQELNDAPRWCSVCRAEHGWPDASAT